MAGSLNKVELIGNLTRDPEIKQFPNGGEIANFLVATNRSYKTDDGEKKDIPEYHNIVVFGKMVQVVSNYLRKGAKVFIEGRLQTRSWETKEGEKRYTTEIVMNNLIMLDKKESGGNGGNGGQYSSAKKQEYQNHHEDQEEEVNIDDLPF